MKLLRIIIRILFVLCVSLGFLISPGDTSAQEASPFSVDLAFSTLGYSTVQLSGDRQGRWFNFSLPQNLRLQPGSYLELTITHTPDVPSKPSALSISLNNVPLEIVPLTAENADLTTYRYSVDDILTPGRNRLQITLDTGATCEEQGASVIVAILDSSLLHLEYGLTQYAADLSLYPLPFYEESFQAVETLLVLPDDPTPVELSAAATLSAGLGAYSRGEARLAITTASALTPELQEQDHLIVIGTPERNPLLEQLSLPRSISSETLEPEWGVLQALPSPWNPYRMTLVVSGLTEAGVLKAAQALNRPLRFPGLKGPVAVVAEVQPPPEEQEQTQVVNQTLADMGNDDEILYGAQPQTITYYFYLPMGWRLQSDPRFVLAFNHSRAVDPQNSVVDVSLNGVPLESVLLDDSNAEDGILEIELSPWALQSGTNRLRVDVEMNRIQGTKCGDLLDSRLWTVLRKDSYLHLAYTRTDFSPHLGLFPYPFHSNPNLTDLLIVTPDTVSASLLQDLMTLATEMGANARGDFIEMNVQSASDVSAQMLSDYHLIFLGTPTTHSLIAQINDLLPQPFEEDTGLLKPVIDSVALVPDPSRTLGLLEEIPSPWNADNTLLVITGTAEEGVGWALQVLLNYTGKLKGNLAIAEQYVTETEEGETIVGYDFYSTETRSGLETQRGVQPVLPDRERWITLADRWW